MKENPEKAINDLRGVKTGSKFELSLAGENGTVKCRVTKMANNSVMVNYDGHNKLLREGQSLKLDGATIEYKDGVLLSKGVGARDIDKVPKEVFKGDPRSNATSQAASTRAETPAPAQGKTAKVDTSEPQRAQATKPAANKPKEKVSFNNEIQDIRKDMDELNNIIINTEYLLREAKSNGGSTYTKYGQRVFVEDLEQDIKALRADYEKKYYEIEDLIKLQRQMNQ